MVTSGGKKKKRDKGEMTGRQCQTWTFLAVESCSWSNKRLGQDSEKWNRLNMDKSTKEKVEPSGGNSTMCRWSLWWGDRKEWGSTHPNRCERAAATQRDMEEKPTGINILCLSKWGVEYWSNSTHTIFS